MRMLLAGGASTIAVAPLLLAGLPAVAGSARAASACQSWTGVQPPDPGGPSAANALDGVAVLSSCDAWAVGSYSNGAARQALVVRWRGSAWKTAASPDPGGPSHDNDLSGVVATSASAAWAVGGYVSGTAFKTLILRWNGTAWKQVASQNPGGSSHDNVLAAVAATSSGNAWAVGAYSDGTADQTLILHWNGTAWKKVASPDPGGTARNNFLNGVTATSAGNAWAVGRYFNGTAYRTLILHWNGTAWKQVASPNAGSPADNQVLASVTATSAGNGWAVGSYNIGAIAQTLILHWNGTAWKKVASPDPGGPSHSHFLFGVAATSAGNAWAVGGYVKTGPEQTLILHWNGTAWKAVASPDPGGSTQFNDLAGVAATSARNAWAVGVYSNGTAIQTLALHCC